MKTQLEDTESNSPQDLSAPEPSSQELSKYNNWLADFQKDITKIVSSKRFSSHLLSHDEVVSEVNMSLVNKRADLIHYMKQNGGFNYNNFKKSAFVYTRNLTKWSHSSATNKSYVKRRDDGVYYDEEEGFKTAFELAVSTKGVNPEDDAAHFVNVEQNEKISDCYKLIKKYYNILTPSEVRVLSMLEKGLTEKQMAKNLNITRQAVNYCIKNLSKKITSHLNFKEIKESGFKKVVSGKHSIHAFFSPNPNRIKKAHSIYIQEFILLNRKKFTLQDVTNHINDKFKSSYTSRQICSSLSVRNLYTHHIIKD